MARPYSNIIHQDGYYVVFACSLLLFIINITIDTLSKLSCLLLATRYLCWCRQHPLPHPPLPLHYYWYLWSYAGNDVVTPVFVL